MKPQTFNEKIIAPAMERITAMALGIFMASLATGDKLPYEDCLLQALEMHCPAIIKDYLRNKDDDTKKSGLN